MIKYLVTALLKPDQQLIRKEICDLISNNNFRYGIEYNGFKYKNDYFEDGRVISNLKWDPQLHPDLEPRAVGLAQRWRAIEEDYSYISETFMLMTRKGRGWQDFRNDLPDCVIQLHPELYSIPRTATVEYNLGDDARLKFRYQMLLPRLHTYSAMSLLT